MSESITTPGAARDQLVADMKAVIADTEELLKATAGVAGDQIAAVRTRAQERLATAKSKLTEFDQELIEQAKDAARAADDYVREHPWGAIGIAAVAGLLVGVLVSRR